jgi:plastocyanin
MSSLRLAAVAVVLVFAFACSDSSNPSTSPSPTPSAAPAPGVPSSSITIPVGAQSLGNRAYVPAELNVAVGAKVTWMNGDLISHTSTSNAAGWDSGIVAPGGQFSFVFQNVGTFPYHCAIHPGMVGTVVVR